MTLTRYGIREWGFAMMMAIIVLVICYFICRAGYHVTAAVLGALALLFFLGIAAFFRNPSRKIPAAPNALVSPADGVVKDIGIVEDFNFPPFHGRAKRVGIFLSVFNVHVNRAPAELKVESKFYREGRYLDARDAGCIKENEAMTIAGLAKADGKEFPMAVRQISGAIARRIVCPVQPGRQLTKGEIYGMIKFGSRTELYLPVDDNIEIKVKIGDKVYGGETVIAEVK